MTRRNKCYLNLFLLISCTIFSKLPHPPRTQGLDQQATAHAEWSEIHIQLALDVGWARVINLETLYGIVPCSCPPQG